MSGHKQRFAAGIWIDKKEQNMTTTKIALFAGAAVVVAGGLVLAIQNESVNFNQGWTRYHRRPCTSTAGNGPT